MPAAWLDSLSKRRKMDKEVTSRILSVSPSTLDRVLSKFKTDVSQKRNRHKARELIGYERIDEEECVYLLNQVYRYHNLLTNFFAESKKRNPDTGKRIP